MTIKINNTEYATTSDAAKAGKELGLQPQTREQWLEARKNGIGGSDAAAILGLNPWKSPLALYNEKIGLLESDSLDDKEYVEWGNILEPVIAEKYEKVTGRQLHYPGPFVIQQNENYPHMLATVDRFIVDCANTLGVLEIKTTSAYAEKKWDIEPPEHYQIQLQHSLIVTGLTQGSFALLVGGQKFIWMDVPKNEAFCALLIEKEQEFWHRLETGNPPEADGSESTKEAIRRLYPKDSGETIQLPAYLQSDALKLEAVKAAIKDAKEAKQLYENRIQAAIGGASIGLFPDGTGFSFKQQTRAAHEVKESTFRVLRKVKK